MSEEKYNPLKSPYHPLKHLAAMRHLVKDEIPPEIVHSNDPDVASNAASGPSATLANAVLSDTTTCPAA